MADLPWACSLGDAYLELDDYSLLTDCTQTAGKGWINDAVIHFALELLCSREQSHLPSESERSDNISSASGGALLSTTSPANTATFGAVTDQKQHKLPEPANTVLPTSTYLPPSLVQMLVLCGLSEDTVAPIIHPLSLLSYQLVLIPVNDCVDAEAVGGGSHWTLLAWYVRDCTFVYYDSARRWSRALPLSQQQERDDEKRCCPQQTQTHREHTTFTDETTAAHSEQTQRALSEANKAQRRQQLLTCASSLPERVTTLSQMLYNYYRNQSEMSTGSSTDRDKDGGDAGQKREAVHASGTGLVNTRASAAYAGRDSLPTNPFVFPASCPVQSNGYDCGMHVICLAEKLAVEISSSTVNVTAADCQPEVKVHQTSSGISPDSNELTYRHKRRASYVSTVTPASVRDRRLGLFREILKHGIK